MPTTPHSRAHINLQTDGQIMCFIQAAQHENDEYVVEDFAGVKRVSARSMLGMMYAVAEFDALYLVNQTEDGYIPARFDEFRA